MARATPYTFRCLSCGATHVKRLTPSAFLDYAPPLCCGRPPRRYVDPGVTSAQATAATNARARFDTKYPYASMRLPKRMKGLPHADGRTKYGDYVPAAGTTLIPDKRTERDLMAGRFNGERYARD